jgi:hypothetical protein
MLVCAITLRLHGNNFNRCICYFVCSMKLNGSFALLPCKKSWPQVLIFCFFWVQLRFFLGFWFYICVAEFIRFYAFTAFEFVETTGILVLGPGAVPSRNPRRYLSSKFVSPEEERTKYL